MSWLRLFSLHNLALVSDWLEQAGELFVHIYFPRRGDYTGYLFQSMEELKRIVLAQDWHQIEFTVYRGKRKSLRGIASVALLEQALQQFREDENFDIFHFYDDLTGDCWGCGKGHIELRRDIINAYDEPVVIIGERVQPGISGQLIVEEPDNHQRRLKRNQDFYEPYASNPERYAWLAELWRE